MRTWLDDAPRWVQVLVIGTAFGAAMGLWHYLSGESVASAVGQGAVGGVVFGAVMATWRRRVRTQERAAIGPLPDGLEPTVRRAAFRGPVPTDPAVRASAARLAAVQLAESRRHRLRDVAVFGVLILCAASLALSSAWWSLALAWTTALLVGRLWEPRRLQRRLALLDDAGVSARPAHDPH